MGNEELTLEVVEAKLKTLLTIFNSCEKKEKTKTDFVEHYTQNAYKYLIEGLDHIESAKRADKRLAELPALIEAKIKEIDSFSSSTMPAEYHKKENREKVKVLNDELTALEAEQRQFPEDVKFRLTQANVSFKNFGFNMERIDLVKRLE